MAMQVDFKFHLPNFRVDWAVRLHAKVRHDLWRLGGRDLELDAWTSRVRSCTLITRCTARSLWHECITSSYTCLRCLRCSITKEGYASSLSPQFPLLNNSWRCFCAVSRLITGKWRAGKRDSIHGIFIFIFQWIRWLAGGDIVRLVVIKQTRIHYCTLHYEHDWFVLRRTSQYITKSCTMCLVPAADCTRGLVMQIGCSEALNVIKNGIKRMDSV